MDFRNMIRGGLRPYAGSFLVGHHTVPLFPVRLPRNWTWLNIEQLEQKQKWYVPTLYGAYQTANFRYWDQGKSLKARCELRLLLPAMRFLTQLQNDLGLECRSLILY
ncbi:MAG: hypothetical protein JWN70_236 [Planctomycetaceae bacterium]|nr:hypothetical protein [Planctomycetaceae bacterium]